MNDVNTAHSRRYIGQGFAAVEFYGRVFLVSGACSIRHQLFLPASKSRPNYRDGKLAGRGKWAGKSVDLWASGAAALTAHQHIFGYSVP